MVAFLFSLALISSIVSVFFVLQQSSAQGYVDESQFTLWTDPDGRYEIQYPSDWEAEVIMPETNFVSSGCCSVSLTISNNTIPGVNNTMDLFHQMDQAIRQGMSIDPLILNAKDIQFIDPLNLNKKLGKHQAVPAIYTVLLSLSPTSNYVSKTLRMGSIIDGSLVTIRFEAGPVTFDEKIPLVNHMIESFKAINLKGNHYLKIQFSV